MPINFCLFAHNSSTNQARWLPDVEHVFTRTWQWEVGGEAGDSKLWVVKMNYLFSGNAISRWVNMYIRYLGKVNWTLQAVWLGRQTESRRREREEQMDLHKFRKYINVNSILCSSISLEQGKIIPLRHSYHYNYAFNLIELAYLKFPSASKQILP